MSGKSKIIDIDIPSIRVISKKTTPIAESIPLKQQADETPEPPRPEKKPKKKKDPDAPKMKDGTQPKGTGRGGNPPPKHGQFQAGTTPNPGGRPKDPPGMKEMKFLTKVELVRVGNLILNKTPVELKAFVDDHETNSLNVMIASVVARIIRTGDMNMLNALLDRLIGKVKEEVRGDLNLNVTEGGEVRVAGVRKVFALPSNGRERNQNQPA